MKLVLISNCECCPPWPGNSCVQPDLLASRSFAVLWMNRIVGNGGSSEVEEALELKLVRDCWDDHGRLKVCRQGCQ